jgi:hypothetical protein
MVKKEHPQCQAINQLVGEQGNRPKTPLRSYSERWGKSETEQFYLALRLFGTDFDVLASCLQNRTRQQVKIKYKRENKLNPAQVEFALSTRMNLSRGEYEGFIGELRALLAQFR